MKEFKIGDRVTYNDCGYDYSSKVFAVHDGDAAISVDGKDGLFCVGLDCIRPYIEHEQNYEQSIKNINDRLGRLEAKEGKLSKTQVKDIETQLNAIRKRLDFLGC